MKLLDFLSTLPAEEKDIFLNILEETESVDMAVKGTMMVLADSEPKLATQLEEIVRGCFKVNEPGKNRNGLSLAYEMAKAS